MHYNNTTIKAGINQIRTSKHCKCLSYRSLTITTTMLFYTCTTRGRRKRTRCTSLHAQGLLPSSLLPVRFQPAFPFLTSSVLSPPPSLLLCYRLLLSFFAIPLQRQQLSCSFCSIQKLLAMDSIDCYNSFQANDVTATSTTIPITTTFPTTTTSTSDHGLLFGDIDCLSVSTKTCPLPLKYEADLDSLYLVSTDANDVWSTDILFLHQSKASAVYPASPDPFLAPDVSCPAVLPFRSRKQQQNSSRKESVPSRFDETVSWFDDGSTGTKVVVPENDYDNDIEDHEIRDLDRNHAPVQTARYRETLQKHVFHLQEDPTESDQINTVNPRNVFLKSFSTSKEQQQQQQKEASRLILILILPCRPQLLSIPKRKGAKKKKKGYRHRFLLFQGSPLPLLNLTTTTSTLQQAIALL
jgi:hypothetical protein